MEVKINENIKSINSSDKVKFTNSSFGNSTLSEIKGSIGSINVVISSSSISDSLDVNEQIISEFSKYDIKEHIKSNWNYCLQSVNSFKHNPGLYNKIYKIRNIGKDKNNFINCVIFSYLENLVLNKNIDGIKELINKINEIKLTFGNINEQNKKKIIDILYILISYLTQENKDKAYMILLKSFIFLEDFILFFNYFTKKLIYDYIIKNLNNSLSPEEPKKIFELLPNQYNQDKNGNQQLLNDLMNMNFEISYNEIYSKVIPYIFHLDLIIIVYKEDNTDIKEIKYKYNGNDSLNLIYFEKEKYFSIFYSKDFYQKFITFLNIVNSGCSKCNIIMEQKNNFNLCDNCLLKAVEDILYINYLNYLEKKDINKFTESHIKKIIKQLSECPCEINNKNIEIKELINEQGLDINKLFSKIKQKICLICRNNINNNNAITLPCECKFCSQKCLDIYMKEIEQRNEYVNDHGLKVIIPMSECFCGYQYKLQDFNNLKNELEHYNNKEYIAIIETAIENNLKIRCILCNKLFNNVDKFITLKLKDEKEHLICKKCSMINNINLENNNEEFFCPFCNKNHHIKSWDDFNGFPECVII